LGFLFFDVHAQQQLADSSKAKYTKADIDKFIAENKLVMIDFSAGWCIPCHKMAAIIEELEKENKNLKVVRVDYDINKTLAVEMNVYEIPYVMLYINGKLKENIIGVMPKEHIEEMMKN
ncbi:MAG: thioredoxin family protein, partial [Ignavibacteria bacterium]|nr:thioredoxin family protein [Ignavibacteria bacterium]